jgi:hypothetical protein
MAKNITYSLCGETNTSDNYYRAIAGWVDEWLPGAAKSMVDIIAGFRKYRTDLGHPDRTDAECTFELLVLGVLLREHGGEAERWPDWATWALELAIHAPEHWAKLEPASKQMRGWVGNLARRAADGNHNSGMDVDQLVSWMRANGQGTRADRLDEWCDYLEPISSATSQRTLVMVMALADDFERVSQRILGLYTQGVEGFRAAAARKYDKRYDAELVTRTPLEYHLGMVGTEVLNRVNRERFLATKRRVVILPPCMRARSEEECKATPTDLGAKCLACTPGCHVNQVTRLGEKRGFEVYMIPSEMHHIGAESARTDGGVGLVGVSCALTNWSGGWDAEGLHIPAQGVLLDYVGCKYHWDDEGIETTVNLRQIETIAAEQPVAPVMQAA